MPINSEIVFDTDGLSIEESVSKIMDYLGEKGLIGL